MGATGGASDWQIGGALLCSEEYECCMEATEKARTSSISKKKLHQVKLLSR